MNLPELHPAANPEYCDQTIEDLDHAIVNLSARIYASTHDLLILVRRFDERCGWLKWGFHSCAEWLHWRCDIGLSAAREKVRVAHALKTLPVIGSAFAAGKLSYSKVRALTRVADRDNEEALVTFALRVTAATVESRCQEMQLGTGESVTDANRAHERRSLRIRRDRSRGTMIFILEVPLEQGELIDKALDKARETTSEAAGESGPEFADRSWSQQQADAFVSVAGAYLSGTAERSTPDHYQVMVHVEQSALAIGKGRASLPLETVKRLGCDGSTVVIVEDDDGKPLSVGRKTRTVTAAIRRALWARDGHCRFPGCRHTRFCHAHHVRHWADGGETRLENLLLLCSQHHRLLHEGGFRIDADYLGQWYFVRPDGKAVPPNGYRPEDMLDDDIHTSAERSAPGSAEDPANPSAEGFALSGVLNHPSAEGRRRMARRLAAQSPRSRGRAPPAPTRPARGRKSATSRVQSRPACGMRCPVHDL